MGGGWIGRRASRGTMLLLVCAFVPALLQPVEEQCEDGDYRTEIGHCCNKCSPGFKLSKECQATGQKSSCVRCDNNQYMDRINFERNCKQCKRCKEQHNEIVVSECKRNQNTICRCKDGYYKSVISTKTYECLTCTVCGSDERQTHACTPEKNTECVCKETFYREKNKCVPCKSCTDECKHLCSEPPLNTIAPKDHHGHLVNIIVGIVVVAVFLLVLVFSITYFVTKQSTEKRLLNQPISSAESPDSAEQFLIVTGETSGDLVGVKAVPSPSLPSEQESSNLPDCVPLEIKTPELIYLLLDLVPVHQVKQLVRSLGVSDTVIERAELDHRSSREAHYQMLRAWAERGSPAVGGGVRGGMLHRPLLQELIDTLRSIHLGGAAEDLEAKYSIQ